jgi:YgiT-type zinc finger domain-containing protein
MKCTIQGCPGTYEPQLVTRSFKRRDKIIVLDGVPAEVCAVCGDVLIRPDTVEHIEKLLRERHDPDGSVPLYRYA